MLKLKKLQILGFKSFCDRTELKFHGDGIAAIIGPNGCGKSNIADAISWVLGEQSAKTLRGSRMEDVIFAGTGERKPTGMAEVSLTLIDPEVYAGPDAHDATEVEIRDPDSGAFEDWDESVLRSDAAAETERLTEEVQPGPNIESSETATLEDADHPQVEGPEAEGLQVVLKIRRRKFQQQRPAGEIVVTRRLFRTGESEYLLNGKLCRLRDIQELFMGTGLGPESYALIEQGRIGQILSSRPTDRRAIIEEAAGITKFKTKKRLAEARLEGAKQNLARVNDIFEEVTRQMNSLKRQASKAERHAKLRDEIRARLRTVLASKFALLDRERTELNARIAALTQEMDLQIEAVQTREAEHAQSMQRGYAIETDLRENRERLNQVKREIERAKSQRQHNLERCAELTARSVSSEAELAQTARRLSTLEADLASNRQALESAANELTAAQHLLASSQEDVAAAGVALSELESRQEQYRSNTIETATAVSDRRNQLTQSTERMAAAGRESERLMQQVAAIDSQMAAFGGRRGQLALEFETASQHMAGLTAEITKARDAIADRRHEEADVKNHLDGLRTEFATILGKKASLEAVIAEHGYSTESVRRLFQSGVMNGGLAPVGVLADFLEVEGRYEGVVEDFLRDELNYVVVKSWDAADEGLRLLRTDVDGRATFLVHPEDSQAKFSFLAGESERPNPADQSIVPLKHTIRVLDGFGKSLEVILPKLRDGYIVPDPSFARALALENPDAFFLSQSGECFHNVTVTGGKQRSEGPLSMKRELRDVVRISGELEAALGHQELRILELGRELKELNSLHERLENEKREYETQTMASQHRLQQMDSEMARLTERRATYAAEHQRITVEQAEHQPRIAGLRTELEGLQSQQRECEQLSIVAQEQLHQLRQRRDRAVQHASQSLARVATLDERHRSVTAVLGPLESLVSETLDRVDSLRLQIESSTIERLKRENENHALAIQVTDLEDACNASEAREGLLQCESEQLRARVAELDEALRLSRQLLDQSRDLRGELSASAAKLHSDAEHMQEQCLNELGVTPQDLLHDDATMLLAGNELMVEDQAYREMRTRLEGMGPVNMMALEEYQEAAGRHTFLDTQRTDLLNSIENTQATIKEIDVFSRQKFEEAFSRINENFQTTFRKLFGGGHAFMRLTDEENSAESGIDVVASPPGKKLQNVLLLSGGEKALTALSLLVGIFQYQPSPFCILDEVDAPLDEANIGRFTELVKEMSLQTQFVLITHSKKTMSIAPVLYGVTMQQPGVSKLVSVRFGATA